MRGHFLYLVDAHIRITRELQSLEKRCYLKLGNCNTSPIVCVCVFFLIRYFMVFVFTCSITFKLYSFPTKYLILKELCGWLVDVVSSKPATSLMKTQIKVAPDH